VWAGTHLACVARMTLVAAHKAAGSWTAETIDFVQGYATDIVVSNGTMDIVYPEPDENGLSYAKRDASGVWSARSFHLAAFEVAQN
jgi:hypothetical protein